MNAKEIIERNLQVRGGKGLTEDQKLFLVSMARNCFFGFWEVKQGDLPSIADFREAKFDLSEMGRTKDFAVINELRLEIRKAGRGEQEEWHAKFEHWNKDGSVVLIVEFHTRLLKGVSE